MSIGFGPGVSNAVAEAARRQAGQQGCTPSDGGGGSGRINDGPSSGGGSGRIENNPNTTPENSPSKPPPDTSGSGGTGSSTGEGAHDIMRGLSYSA